MLPKLHDQYTPHHWLKGINSCPPSWLVCANGLGYEWCSQDSPFFVVLPRVRLCKGVKQSGLSVCQFVSPIKNVETWIKTGNSFKNWQQHWNCKRSVYFIGSKVVLPSAFPAVSYWTLGLSTILIRSIPWILYSLVHAGSTCIYQYFRYSGVQAYASSTRVWSRIRSCFVLER